MRRVPEMRADDVPAHAGSPAKPGDAEAAGRSEEKRAAAPRPRQAREKRRLRIHVLRDRFDDDVGFAIDPAERRRNLDAAAPPRLVADVLLHPVLELANRTVRAGDPSPSAHVEERPEPAAFEGDRSGRADLADTADAD